MNVWDNIWINEKVSWRILNKNINTDLYTNILKKRNNEMNKIFRKGYILMRYNVPSFISEKTIQFIKEQRLMNLKEWPAYSPDLNPLENVWRLIKSQMMNKEIYKNKSWLEK